MKDGYLIIGLRGSDIGTTGYCCGGTGCRQGRKCLFYCLERLE